MAEEYSQFKTTIVDNNGVIFKGKSSFFELEEEDSSWDYDLNISENRTGYYFAAVAINFAKASIKLVADGDSPFITEPFVCEVIFEGV